MKIPYSLVLPPDLPPGGLYEDKMDIPHFISGDGIKGQYASMHRRGWQDCIRELDHDWVLDRKPMFLMQGYGWQARGYTDGYDACLTEVRTTVQTIGVDQARQAVHNTCASSPP